MVTNTARAVVPQVIYIGNLPRVTIWPMAKQPHYIKEWRKHRGLTQDRLAERIGIDRAYLSKIESGKRRYDQPFLEAAAVVLQCEPADLIIRDPSDPDGIWSVWDTLRPVERQQVVEIAKTIKRTGTEG
jgi:transcriptional regulator with XRE-family HTH domain